MPEPTEYWVAGVYIREAQVSCIVGQVDLPADVSQIPQIKGQFFPRTKNRRSIKIPDTPCDAEDPKGSLMEAAARLKAAMRDAGKHLSCVHIACFGGFWASQRGRKHQKPVFGVLNNVRAYPTEWNGLDLRPVSSTSLR